MNKITFVFLGLFFSTLMAQAREINVENPDFSHEICLTNSKYNPGAAYTRRLKQEALELLFKIKNSPLEERAQFNSLDSIEKRYLFKYINSIASDGVNLFSLKLDQELDLAGSCEAVTDTLNYIIGKIR